MCECPLHTQEAVDGHGQDVLVDQLYGPWPVGDLVVEVVGQPSSLQLQLLGLQGGLGPRLCVHHSTTQTHTHTSTLLGSETSHLWAHEYFVEIQ